MTEAEWLSCSDPDLMLDSLGWKEHLPESQRRFRLFAVACCRRVGHLMTEEPSRAAVEVAERHIEGLASDAELRAAEWAARAVYLDAFLRSDFQRHDVPPAPREGGPVQGGNFLAAKAAWSLARGGIRIVRGQAARDVAQEVAIEAAWAVAPAHFQGPERGEQARLVRCVFGNPFRPPAVQAAWLRWNDGTVPRLARSIYDRLRWGDMGVLHDALLESGCDDADMLSHARVGEIHARGCWLLDLLLMKG